MFGKSSMKKEDILNSLYPTYLFCFVLGFAPFKIHRCSYSLKIVHMKIFDWFTLLAYTMFISTIFYIHFYMVSLKTLNSALQRFFTLLYFIIVAGFLSINVTFNKIHRTSTTHLYKRLYDIDYELKRNGIILDYKYLTWASMRFILLGWSFFTTYILFLTFSQEYAYKARSYLLYFILYFTILTFVSNTCIFVSMHRCIAHMFQKLLEGFENVVLINKNFTKEYKCHAIAKCAILHQNLCELSRLANNVTSVQMLVSFAVTFILIIIQTYSIVCSFFNSTAYMRYAIGSFVCIVIFVTEKMVIIYVSHINMNMIVKTKCLLGKILNLYASNDRICKEINAFGLQILHEQFETTAGKLFTIDLPIFVSMCSTILTYITLLVQADPLVDLYRTMKDSLGVV